MSRLKEQDDKTRDLFRMASVYALERCTVDHATHVNLLSVNVYKMNELKNHKLSSSIRMSGGTSTNNGWQSISRP